MSRVGEELGHVRRAMLLRFRLANFVCRVMPARSLSTVRAALYRLVGFKIAPRVSFLSAISVVGSGPGVYGRLSIGDGTVIGESPTFNLDDRITIGENASLGPSVAIWTSTHRMGPSSRRMSPEVMARPVVIEDGVWVRVGALILPGVTIGRGSVVGAGSVVAEDVPPNVVVSGNPAVVQKELRAGDEQPGIG